MIVESGQTCDFKRANDFFGLFVASQDPGTKSHFSETDSDIYNSRNVRAASSHTGRVTVAQEIEVFALNNSAMTSAGDEELKLALEAL